MNRNHKNPIQYSIIKKILFSLFSGLVIFLTYSCDKNGEQITNSDLLTNNSSKVWYLTKMVNKYNIAVQLEPCQLDDQNKFMINGDCLIDNMGSVIEVVRDPYSNLPMAQCKDTADVINLAHWKLSDKKDSLTISSKKYTISGKILKLTTDSLIIKRTYPDYSAVQVEYYASSRS